MSAEKETSGAVWRIVVPPPTRSQPNGHPADGMTMHVPIGDGMTMDILDPRSFDDGGLEWVLRYGNVQAVRYTAATILANYDYLLSDDITTKDAIRRLRILRAYRRAASTTPSQESANPSPPHAEQLPGPYRAPTPTTTTPE